MGTLGNADMREPGDLRLVLGISLADYLHDRRLSLPLVISLAAVLAPLLVLFGLKFGIISSMSRELTRDPRTLELRPLGQGRYDAAWLAELGARPEVAFLLPSTRFLAATMSLRNRANPEAEPLRVELRPSAAGDPLLDGLDAAPDGFSGIILAAPAAEALRVNPGERLQGRIARTRKDGQRETLRLQLRVDAVLPPARSSRLEALVGVEFLLAAEDFREGFAVPRLESDGRARPGGERQFASFRLYARDIGQVAALRRWLAERGVRTDTRLAEIELLQRLGHSLDTLFLIVAGLGGSGYLIALTVSLWTNTERKRRELAVLRLVGLRSTALAAFPVTQALLTALLGSLAAGALYLPVERLINHLFRDSLAAHQVLSRLQPGHLLAAVGITLLFALLASLAAGLRAAAISPAEGLRDE
jgi:putative ABC transport system permease protein